MKTRASKTTENKSQAVINHKAQKQGASTTAFQFVDNRPEAVLQRKIQTMADNRTTPLAQNQEELRKNNTGLPDSLKSGIESLSGYSLDDVKVHRNSDKPATLQAHAYAQGTDIHLGPGQDKHLPHEAWHVVQQKQGRVKPTLQMKGGVNVNDDSGLEKEADLMGAKAISNKKNINCSESIISKNIDKKSTENLNSSLPIQAVFGDDWDSEDFMDSEEFLDAFHGLNSEESEEMNSENDGIHPFYGEEFNNDFSELPNKKKEFGRQKGRSLAPNVANAYGKATGVLENITESKDFRHKANAGNVGGHLAVAAQIIKKTDKSPEGIAKKKKEMAKKGEARNKKKAKGEGKILRKGEKRTARVLAAANLEVESADGIMGESQSILKSEFGQEVEKQDEKKKGEMRKFGQKVVKIKDAITAPSRQRTNAELNRGVQERRAEEAERLHAQMMREEAERLHAQGKGKEEEEEEEEN